MTLLIHYPYTFSRGPGSSPLQRRLVCMEQVGVFKIQMKEGESYRAIELPGGQVPKAETKRFAS